MRKKIVTNDEGSAPARVDAVSRKYILLFILALVTPYSISVNLGPLVITSVRVIGMFFCFKMLNWLKIRRTYLYGSKYFDTLAFCHCAWVFLAILVNHGLGKALESGGIYFLEFFPFYMFGRYVAMRPERITYFVKVFFKTLLILMPFAYIESFTGINIIDSIVTKLGFPSHLAPTEERFGLNRASATMPHPILYGLFASCMIGLACFSLGGSKIKRLGWMFLAAFPSLSSAPLLSVCLQGSLMAWNHVLKAQPRRWYYLLGLFALAYVAIEILSNRDTITVLMNYLTFNAQTGYWRKLIWEYGLAEIFRSPVFGIGFNDWVRPAFMWSPSVDSFWLLNTMRFGVPYILFLFVLTGSVMRRFLSRNFLHMNDFRLGWFISMVGIIMVGITVHFWASTFVIYAFLMGIGVSLSSYKISSSAYSQSE